MRKKGEFKKTKFEERILNEANIVLRRTVSDPRLQFVSFTKVELSSDFSMAKLYWDTFDPGKRGDIKAGVENMKSMLRSHLAKTLDVRHTPSLSFEYDSQYESEAHINGILQKEKDDGKFGTES